MILQRDNGRKFVTAAISEFKLLWPEFSGSIERSNQDVSNMAFNWCHENKSTKWSIGLKFVKFDILYLKSRYSYKWMIIIVDV